MEFLPQDIASDVPSFPRPIGVNMAPRLRWFTALCDGVQFFFWGGGCVYFLGVGCLQIGNFSSVRGWLLSCQKNPLKMCPRVFEWGTSTLECCIPSGLFSTVWSHCISLHGSDSTGALSMLGTACPGDVMMEISPEHFSTFVAS